MIQESARIQGRKSKRKLTAEQSREMLEKRWGKKEDKDDAGV